MRHFALALSSVAAAALTAGAADAAVLQFSFSGPGVTASFLLPESPTPTRIFPNEFGVGPTTGVFNAAPITFDDLFFFDAATDGGFAILKPSGDILLAGAQLFTGTTAAPSFVPGTYALVDYDTREPGFSLSIAVVPEPATWAMMLAGFGLAGTALRRQRIRVSFA